VADVAEPELMSVELPVAEPVVPEAPMEVPLPVVPIEELEPAVVSVLVPVPVVVEAELLVSDGSVVVDGVVAVEVDEEGVDVSAGMVAVSSFLPQALRDRAAIRARAAHCAIGDLIIRNSLWVSFRDR
jgi:hypothetical protein